MSIETSSRPPKIGQVVPDFTLPDLDGHSVSLRELRGRKLIIFAWASW